MNPHSNFEIDNKLTPYVSFPSAMRQEAKQDCLYILESLWPIMKHYPHSIFLPPKSENDVDSDYKYSPYSEKNYQMFCPLNQALTEDTIQLNVSGCDSLVDATAVFYDTGIHAFFKSDGVRELAERVTGYSLVLNERTGILIVCYTHGDYIGVHSDVKWPYWAGWTKKKEGIAYVDVGFSFVNDAVEEQWIIIQNGCFINKVYGGRPPINGTISVNRLPFWHYVTPLKGKAGVESRARRWLVTINFEIAGGNNAPKILA